MSVGWGKSKGESNKIYKLGGQGGGGWGVESNEKVRFKIGGKEGVVQYESIGK